MTTITVLKSKVAELENYPDKGTVFPYVIIWVMPSYKGASSAVWLGEDEPVPVAWEDEDPEGWEVAQIAVCNDQWEKVLFRESGIYTQRGGKKLYKSLDTLVREFKDVFGRSCHIQLRGL